MASPEYKHGDVDPITMPVATALAVNKFDLVALVSNTLQTAAGQTWNTDLATTQADFIANFMGASLQYKKANVARVYGNSDDNKIVVGRAGNYEYDMTTGTAIYEGDYLGPAKDTGNALLSDKLVKVASAAIATHIAASSMASTGTRILARMRRVGRAI